MKCLAQTANPALFIYPLSYIILNFGGDYCFDTSEYQIPTIELRRDVLRLCCVVSPPSYHTSHLRYVYAFGCIVLSGAWLRYRPANFGTGVDAALVFTPFWSFDIVICLSVSSVLHWLFV